MNNPEHETHLEENLAQLTEWPGEETELWRSALEESASTPAIGTGVVARIAEWSTSRKLFAAAAMIAVLCAVGFSVQSILEEPPWIANAASRSPMLNLRNLGTAHATYSDEWNGRQFARVPADITNIQDMDNGPVRRNSPAASSSAPFISGGGGGGGGGYIGRPEDNDLQNTFADDRAVIRKATMHLESKDVRAVYLQAMHLISAVRGEFIDSSTMQGVGETASASITMRVAAERIDEVLNDLRELAMVVSEDKTGDDVTSQMVDLQARLRNEQRVEQELLDLLESRNDAPLKEILQLRDEIAKVRASVERYAAQIGQIDKLVSLATILIIIRYDFDEEPPDLEEPEEEKLGAYFSDNISASWNSGVRFLADTVAFIVEVLIGGLIWWVIAVFCIIMAKQMKHKKTAVA